MLYASLLGLAFLGASFLLAIPVVGQAPPEVWQTAEAPSTPTMEQLFREITALRTLLEARIDGVDKAVGQLQTLHEVKLHSLDARLLAARLAIGERQDATEKLQAQHLQTMQKQFDQFTEILRSADANLNERFQALKERLDRLEGTASGVGTSWGVLVGAVALLGSLVALITNQRRSRSQADERKG